MKTTAKLAAAKKLVRDARKAFDKYPGASNWNLLEAAQEQYQLEWQVADKPENEDWLRQAYRQH